MEEMQKSVQSIKGVGPKISLLLNKMDIFNIEDLLCHYPRFYEDRSNIRPIFELKDGETASVIGVVCLIDKDRFTQRGKRMTRIILKNDTGYIAGVWFNQKFVKNNFKIGQKYLFYGKISRIFGEIQMLSPEYEVIEEETQNNTAAIIPVYSITKNLSQKILRNLLFKLIKARAVEYDDIIPESIRKKYGLCSIGFAIENIHFPDSNSAIDEAQRRLKFEELLTLQLGLMIERHKIERQSKGISFNTAEGLKGFVADLPFKLTNAQRIVARQVLNDMKSDKQMNRLIQGDVGSGKTVIAAISLYNAVKNGYQAILMAPTEILANQHYQSLISLFKGHNIKMQLLSGKMSRRSKEEIKENVRQGEVDVLIGTHALIQDDVNFKNLGLVITDEQHRFGVRQRAILSKKGENPDVLVMTATPIPRTMALFIYGDLDISIINEMPPGRQKIETYAVKPNMRPRIYNFIKREVKKGRQAYIVCPMIEDSGEVDAESAVDLAEKLQTQYLKELKVGLLHGKLKPSEKDSIMTDFSLGKIDVLVSTTVIEVGINVPNATVMVIENADRFGISTLHQLRGRVGRGEYKSYCILISEMKSDISQKRMIIMKDIDDGFKLAEEDLKIRGTGEFFGTKQHGLPELKVADIFMDIDLLKETNKLAKELVHSETIYNDEYNKLKTKVEKKFSQKSQDIALN